MKLQNNYTLSRESGVVQVREPWGSLSVSASAFCAWLKQEVTVSDDSAAGFEEITTRQEGTYPFSIQSFRKISFPIRGGNKTEEIKPVDLAVAFDEGEIEIRRPIIAGRQYQNSYCEWIECEVRRKNKTKPQPK